MAAPLFGLILAGGSSSRMQRDKAGLLYAGKNQLERAYELLSGHVAQVFVSVRQTQTHEPMRAQWPTIVDSVEGAGPIVGIRSAMARFPDVAWLVLACDLPFLTDATLAQLLAGRDPTTIATAFRSSHDGLPEPLCAIWEPSAAESLSAYQSNGANCPRKFLIRERVSLLDAQDPRALDNVNTPADYAAAMAVLAARGTPSPTASPTRRLDIHYFALLREQAGRSHETLDTTATTPAALFEELNARYRFTLVPAQLKVAINSEFSDWSRPLNSGDAVVFIPPVAGG